MGLEEAPGVGNRSRGGALGSEKGGREGVAARKAGPRGRGGLALKPSSFSGGKPTGQQGESDLERVTLCGTNTDAGVEFSQCERGYRIPLRTPQPRPTPRPPPPATPLLVSTTSFPHLWLLPGLERRKVGSEKSEMDLILTLSWPLEVLDGRCFSLSSSVLFPAK